MDWTKAKTILILALVATNLFLLSAYFLRAQEALEKGDHLEEETIALLQAKNIYLKEESLPVRPEKLPALAVRFVFMDQKLYETERRRQIPLELENARREDHLHLAEEFLRRCRLWREDIVLDDYYVDGETTTIIYGNRHQEFRIEESRIVCQIREGRVVSLDYDWLEPVAFGPTKRTPMSASAALISLMDEKHELESILVQEIEMVYWVDQTDYPGENAVSDTAFPTWKICYNNGKIKYVPAFTE